MASNRPSKKRKGAPEWAIEPFENFIDEAEHHSHLMHIAVTGISGLRGTPKLIETLMKLKEEDTPEAAQRLADAKKDADLAKTEVETGFPVLHAWAVVGLWALFESTIRTFASEWLKHKRTAWKAESIQKLRVRIGDYESIPKGLKHRYVIELLERELGTGLKYGINRFETLLEPFGLSGEVPASLGREVYEFAQVRNLIVHSASKVDRRFNEACPWLKVKTGENFHVSHRMFEKYHFVATSYITLLIYRTGTYYGRDFSNELLSFPQAIEKALSDLNLREK